MSGPKAVRIEQAADERAELEARARRRKTSRGEAMRAAIVLLSASGMANLTFAKRLGTTRVTAATWRQRFACRRMDGLSDEPRPGALRKIGDDKITEVVMATLHADRGDPLDHPIDGDSLWPVGLQCAPYLASSLCSRIVTIPSGCRSMPVKVLYRCRRGWGRSADEAVTGRRKCPIDDCFVF
jgi:hypothetical protein